MAPINLREWLVPNARSLLVLVLPIIAFEIVGAAQISLPERSRDALSGKAFANQIEKLDLAARERQIVAEVLRGNVPTFSRTFVEVTATAMIDGQDETAVYLVSPDYLAIGADDDYLLMPISPSAAQAIADALGCVLPTRKMVDDIYRAASVKLAPIRIAPSREMTTVPVFQQHGASIALQRRKLLGEHPPGALVAGHKKDVVLSPQLGTARGKVAIYGWHEAEAKPIQPLYLGHTASWVDYSHGVRLVLRDLTINRAPATIEAVLADPKLSVLLSDEGPLPEARYGTRAFDEEVTVLHLEPDIRVVLNAPARSSFDADKPVRLVLYALPNGNTIEQTVGRRVRTGDDFHWDIQHIGAQTRWLREHATDANLVVAYLDCTAKSWPAWRRQHGDGHIPGIIAAVATQFAGQPLKTVLTGHSGGGSFTFGFLNAVGRIPDEIERIAFLDSNYAYDQEKGHHEKLCQWLMSPGHYLCVFAYHDDIAQLNGKSFVSAAGGTWGRSHAMQQDLAVKFPFHQEKDTEFQRYTALEGRIQFLLKENPSRAILHTRQVELNGFIHALLTGTELEGRGYTYFGGRAYDRWISE